jgi:methylmalonyl-CoA mutase
MMEHNDDLKLFEEFPSVSTEQWEEKILQDLKGADYEKKLIWKPVSGMKVKPYYRMEDLKPLAHMGSLPGGFPFVRGNNPATNNWELRQQIDVEKPADANTRAIDALRRGADAITFKVGDLTKQEEMDRLLQGIDLSKTALHFTSSFSYSILVELILKSLETMKQEAAKAKGSFDFDSIAWYTLNGEFYNSADDNFNELACLINLVQKKLPAFRVLNVNAAHFHNAGANPIQELAFALSVISEYYHQMNERKISPDAIAPAMQLTLAIGSDYFLEIARMRAARMLFAKVAQQYGAKGEGLKLCLHAVNSNFNKTLYDPYVNMLRSTTEAMSAAIGGADAITCLPLNAVYANDDAFTARVSRNTQIILKEESNLDKIVDPAAGSYYIENLTDQIASLVWDEFVKIESMGGYLKAFADGYIRKEVEASANVKAMDVATRKVSVLGTNIFPNLKEEMINDIRKETTAGDRGGLKMIRGAEAFEQLRLATEKYVSKGNKKPSVLLIGYGNLAMRKARANFATNFFGVAGYEILDEYEALDLKQTLHHIMEKDPSVIVYCSSDEEYAGMATEIMQAAAKEKSINAVHVIAGYPKEMLDALKAAGAGDFIHVRSNLLETLTQYQKRFGIL